MADAQTPPTETPIERACRKRSFLRLPIAVDRARLQSEFARIPADAWGVSHWDAHCSIDVLLLRGGNKGEAGDYTTALVENSPLLQEFPYISSLLAEEGPFGGASYAFIFRTKPGGMTRVHTDDHEAWTRTVRIHVPIVTNPGAFLLCEGRAKHLGVGEVWTFDNQAPHSVMNGSETRVHMIIDVRPNPKLAALMQAAQFDAGEPDPERWAATCARSEVYCFARGEPLSPTEKTQLGLAAESFAARVTRVPKKARFFLYSPLRVGDVVISVNGVEASHLCRTSIDYIYRGLKPGDTAHIELLRQGRRRSARVRLVELDHFSLKRRLQRLAPAPAAGR